MQDLKTKEPINIPSAIMGIDTVKVREDLMLESGKESNDPEGVSFTHAKLLIHAPDELFININRNTIDHKGREVKCRRPLVFTKNQTITFQKFQDDMHVSDNDNKTYLTLASNVTYQVKGGSIHLGDSTSYGHYVYVERTAKGTFIYHSDTEVKQISEREAENLLKQASILHLRKVSELPIDEMKLIPLESLLQANPSSKKPPCSLM
jgi:hypothetical protein